MAVSQTVMAYLDERDVDFDIVTHNWTNTALSSADATGVPPRQLVKAVLMYCVDEYILALLPADRRVDANALADLSHETPVCFAPEEDLPLLFRDCRIGAVPAVGPAFGVRTIVDERLLHTDELFFEGGDHVHLVHVDCDGFARLTTGLEHGAFSVPAARKDERSS